MHQPTLRGGLRPPAGAPGGAEHAPGWAQVCDPQLQDSSSLRLSSLIKLFVTGKAARRPAAMGDSALSRPPRLACKRSRLHKLLEVAHTLPELVLRPASTGALARGLPVAHTTVESTLWWQERTMEPSPLQAGPCRTAAVPLAAPTCGTIAYFARAVGPLQACFDQFKGSRLHWTRLLHNPTLTAPASPPVPPSAYSWRARRPTQRRHVSSWTNLQRMRR